MRVVDDYFHSKGDPNRQPSTLLDKVSPDLIEDFHENKNIQRNIWIALAHTFIYTMNVYIVQPTNNSYVAELGANRTLSGLIMGMTHLAAIFCTFYYSYWTNTSYKHPLIFSCIFFMIGNSLYSLADNFQSLFVMGLGRLFIGLASARVVNRRYIIEQVPHNLIMHYSLLYVGLTCLGMGCWPVYRPCYYVLLTW